MKSTKVQNPSHSFCSDVSLFAIATAWELTKYLERNRQQDSMKTSLLYANNAGGRWCWTPGMTSISV